MRQKDRARERYWQTAVFNRAAQIQTQSWPVIGRLWLGLGTGGSDSCLEMMEAPEKGDRKERHHDNNPELLWNSVVPVPSPNTAPTNMEWKIGGRNKSTKGNKLRYKWASCVGTAHCWEEHVVIGCLQS